ncbi:MAG: cell envelope integrity protein TolA [Thermodesulfobacteriota bacterium]
MKPEDKDTSKGTSFWGMFFSVALHAAVLILVLFWGFSGTSNHSSSGGPIQVSLSGIGPGGGQDPSHPSRPKAQPEGPKKAEPAKEEPPKVEEKEEVKVPPPEPEKKEPPKEPEKEEKPKEVVKEEPEKKEVIPLETEKKKEVKKEVKKAEPKKEVAEKPKPTEKPKTESKKTTASSKKNLESEKNKVLQDIKRQRVLEELKSGSEESAAPGEEMGEEQQLAMADSGETPGDSSEGSSESMEGSGSGSSVNPVLLQLYTDKVHQRISRNWRIPPGVPTDGNMQAIVFFKVDQSGRVFDVRVNQSSGNAAFDEYCVSAVRKSAPLPPPPSEFAEEAKTSGVLVPFKNKTY